MGSAMHSFDLTGRRVWVAGHRGMAGSAIVRRLRRESCEIVTVTRSELDLLRQADVDTWMADAKIDAVISRRCDSGWHYGQRNSAGGILV